jgi:integrase
MCQRAGQSKRLRPADVTGLLESCDRRTAAGRRDYAVLVLLARLGLRAGEVAALATVPPPIFDPLFGHVS